MTSVVKLPRLAWRRLADAAAVSVQVGRIDAVLASYPKSGRTWIRFILASYFAEAFGLGTTPDLHSMFMVMPNFDMDPIRGIPAFAFEQAVPRPPLVAVSHLSYSRLRFRRCPAIFMVRDPRDVMVSAYFHATRQKHRFSGEIGPFLADPEQGIAGMIRYLNGWSAGLRHRPHVVVSYEDLSRDPQAETARVLIFLGIAVRPGVLSRAVAAGDFDHMRDLEQATGLPGHEYDRSDRDSLRMRQGRVGGFDDYLDPAQVDLIEVTCNRDLSDNARAVLARTGWQSRQDLPAG